MCFPDRGRSPNLQETDDLLASLYFDVGQEIILSELYLALAVRLFGKHK
jgi:hypothetical protein